MRRAALALLLLAGCATPGPVVIDQRERIIWTADDDQAGRLCWERYGLPGKVACYGLTDDVIVVSRTAPGRLAHEQCHRLGWPADHPWPPPEACR